MKTDTNQLVKVIDFWQKSAARNELFDREILKDINLDTREIVDLIGPRRSGKSSILKLIIKHLNLKNNFLYINFEDPFFIENNKPQIIEEIISIFQEYFDKNVRYVFFDEIQAIDQWEKALRKLRDGGNFRIFITGSSSKLLSGEMSSLITGRHLSHKVFPLSFTEFLAFKKFEVKNKKDIILKEKQLLRKFDNYLIFGGFPEFILSKNPELLKNYFFDIIQKDIVNRYKIREKNILEKMAVYLLSNSAKILSIESLKKTFNISFVSAVSYLGYFKDVFLVFDLPQFSYSLKKQNKAMKKIYVIDNGLAGSVSFKFSEDKGRMLENLVFLELKREGSEICYYKTKENLEVDFLIKKKTIVKNLIQVSWDLSDAKTKEREIKSLFSAIEELKLKNGLLLTYEEEEVIKKDGKTIIVKPTYKWLLEK